jgi:hypothetical protein
MGEEKAGYNYSSPNFKEALENAIDDIYDTHSIITGDNGGKSFIPGKLETSNFQLLFRFQVFNVLQIYFCWLFFFP